VTPSVAGGAARRVLLPLPTQHSETPADPVSPSRAEVEPPPPSRPLARPLPVYQRHCSAPATSISALLLHRSTSSDGSAAAVTAPASAWLEEGRRSEEVERRERDERAAFLRAVAADLRASVGSPPASPSQPEVSRGPALHHSHSRSHTLHHSHIRSHSHSAATSPARRSRAPQQQQQQLDDGDGGGVWAKEEAAALRAVAYFSPPASPARHRPGSTHVSVDHSAWRPPMLSRASAASSRAKAEVVEEVEEEVERRSELSTVPSRASSSHGGDDVTPPSPAASPVRSVARPASAVRSTATSVAWEVPLVGTVASPVVRVADHAEEAAVAAAALDRSLGAVNLTRSLEPTAAARQSTDAGGRTWAWSSMAPFAAGVDDTAGGGGGTTGSVRSVRSREAEEASEEEAEAEEEKAAFAAAVFAAAAAAAAVARAERLQCNTAAAAEGWGAAEGGGAGTAACVASSATAMLAQAVHDDDGDDDDDDNDGRVWVNKRAAALLFESMGEVPPWLRVSTAAANPTRMSASLPTLSHDLRCGLGVVPAAREARAATPTAADEAQFRFPDERAMHLAKELAHQQQRAEAARAALAQHLAEHSRVHDKREAADAAEAASPPTPTPRHDPPQCSPATESVRTLPAAWAAQFSPPPATHASLRANLALPPHDVRASLASTRAEEWPAAHEPHDGRSRSPPASEGGPRARAVTEAEEQAAVVALLAPAAARVLAELSSPPPPPPPAKALAFDAFGDEQEAAGQSKMSLKMPARLQQQLDTKRCGAAARLSPPPVASPLSPPLRLTCGCTRVEQGAAAGAQRGAAARRRLTRRGALAQAATKRRAAPC
jgi:hypothetical protein